MGVLSFCGCPCTADQEEANMSKTTMIILAVGVLLFAFFTCAGVGAYIYTTMPNPNLNPNLAETQLAQMINAALTQTAQVQVPTMAPITLPSSTPTSPFVPPLPTVTPSATL